MCLCARQVCEEARCPNIGECWGGGEYATATATIMVSLLDPLVLWYCYINDIKLFDKDTQLYLCKTHVLVHKDQYLLREKNKTSVITSGASRFIEFSGFFFR